MPFRAVGATALLTLLCWGIWDWASSNGHATIGIIAGILLVPSAIALLGFLAITAAGLARIAAERAASRRERAHAPGENGAAGTPPTGSAGSAAERFAA
jgi:hypothetical protein